MKAWGRKNREERAVIFLRNRLQSNSRAWDVESNSELGRLVAVDPLLAVRDAVWVRF